MAIKPGIKYEYRMKFYNGEYTYYKRQVGKKWYKISDKTYYKETDAEICSDNNAPEGSYIKINGEWK